MESTPTTDALTFRSSRCLALCCFLGAVLFSACAHLKPPAGKDILWVAPFAPAEIARSLGFSPLHAPSVARDSTGDQVFVSFTETNGAHKLILVSANRIQVKDLSIGSLFVDDAGNPFLWYNPSKRPQLANGFLFPTNFGIEDGHNGTNGKFIALWRNTGNGSISFIAQTQAPLTELLTLPPNTLLLFLAQGNRLHIFLKRDTLRYVEYEINANTAHLVRARDFKWAGFIYDFDPESGLMLVCSDAFMFQHAYLANVNTGARRRLGPAPATAYFVKDVVIKQYFDVLKKAHCVTSGVGHNY